MGNNTVGVALAKELCPCCLKELDGPIIMNSLLTERNAQDVEKLHGKVIGFADKFCDDCQNMADQGIILVGVDESKTEDKNNPWRTGVISVIKDEAFSRIFSSELPPKRMAYVEHSMGQRIGLWT